MPSPPTPVRGVLHQTACPCSTAASMPRRTLCNAGPDGRMRHLTPHLRARQEQGQDTTRMRRSKETPGKAATYLPHAACRTAVGELTWQRQRVRACWDPSSQHRRVTSAHKAGDGLWPHPGAEDTTAHNYDGCTAWGLGSGWAWLLSSFFFLLSAIASSARGRGLFGCREWPLSRKYGRASRSANQTSRWGCSDRTWQPSIPRRRKNQKCSMRPACANHISYELIRGHMRHGSSPTRQGVLDGTRDAYREPPLAPGPSAAGAAIPAP